MKAQRICAGPKALAYLARHGLQSRDMGAMPAAAGGPKGLILGPLDQFIFGHWLPQSSQPVDLVGASIGAWRMATACLDDPVAAFKRLEHDYIHQNYALLPGEKRPAASRVSALFGQNLQAFYGGRVTEVLQHPRYRLHVLTSHGRGLLAREHGWRTALGYGGAFVSNLVSRRALGGWLERAVFSSELPHLTGSVAPLPFDAADYPTRQNRPERGQLFARHASQLLDPVCAAGGERHCRGTRRGVLGRRGDRLPPASELVACAQCCTKYSC